MAIEFNCRKDRERNVGKFFKKRDEMSRTGSVKRGWWVNISPGCSGCSFVLARNAKFACCIGHCSAEWRKFRKLLVALSLRIMVRLKWINNFALGRPVTERISTHHGNYGTFVLLLRSNFWINLVRSKTFHFSESVRKRTNNRSLWNDLIF